MESQEVITYTLKGRWYQPHSVDREVWAQGWSNNLHKSHIKALNFVLYLWWPREILSLYRCEKTCLYFVILDPLTPRQPQTLGQIKQWESAALMSHHLFKASGRAAWLFLPGICPFLSSFGHVPLSASPSFSPFWVMFVIAWPYFWGQGCMRRRLRIFF